MFKCLLNLVVRVMLCDCSICIDMSMDLFVSWVCKCVLNECDLFCCCSFCVECDCVFVVGETMYYLCVCILHTSEVI